MSGVGSSPLAPTLSYPLCHDVGEEGLVRRPRMKGDQVFPFETHLLEQLPHQGLALVVSHPGMLPQSGQIVQ